MNIQPNSTKTRIIATIALGSITACGAYFNARNGWSMGAETDEKAALAAVSVAFDISKVLAFAYAIHHIARRAFMPGLLCVAIWIGTAGYSGYSAGSFVFRQIAHANTEQAIINKELTDRAKKIAELEETIKTAKEGINAKSKTYWSSTGGCTAPTKPESVAFCQNYHLSLGDLNDMREKARKDKRQISDGDPVIALWAKILGRTQIEIAIGIAMILAIAIELVASFAGVAFSKSRADINEDRQQAREIERAETRRIKMAMEQERRAQRNEATRRRRKAEKRARGSKDGLRVVSSR